VLIQTESGSDEALSTQFTARIRQGEAKKPDSSGNAMGKAPEGNQL
jgi:hypothetical protein